MKQVLYVVVGQNLLFGDTSARAIYSRLEDAKAHLEDEERMYRDDYAEIVPLVLDEKVKD